MRTVFDIPFLTEDIPGTGGEIKREIEDFLVEERPLYEPCGEGEHLYLYIEKRGISTFDVTRELAEVFQVSPRSVSYAGLKDVKAIARQYVCVPGGDEGRLETREFKNFRILDVSRHTNKLRTGHLSGNYFRVRVRGVEPADVPRAREILDVLARRGAANFYGPQRFGSHGRNALFGRALVKQRYRRGIQAVFAPCSAEEGTGIHQARRYAWEGRYNRSLRLFPHSFVPERNLAIALRDAAVEIWGGETLSKGAYRRLLRRVPKRYLEFYVSALQAYLFNEVLKRRYRELDRLMEGDYAYIHGKGAVFPVEDPAAEQPRVDRLEISPSGPIFGYKVPLAKGAPGEIEWGVLHRAHIKLGQFHMKIGLKNKGVRRPLRVPVREVSLEENEDGFTAGFFLPKGSYATTVMREIIKPAGWEEMV